MLKTQGIIIYQRHSCTEESWKHMFQAPGWLSLFSVRLLILAQVVTSGLWDPAPHQARHWAWSVLKIVSHTATLENNTEIPQKVKSRPTLQPSNCTTRYLPRGYKYTDPKEHLHPNDYSSYVHNSQTMQRAQVSTNKWKHKHGAGCLLGSVG